MNQQAARAALTHASGWRKSSYSKGANDCVEIASLEGGRHAVRDSKDPTGAILTFTTPAWNMFTASARAGEFD